jgi:phosphatidylethanolamine/phosphatidyl-N-methylethanolamine N-methyltransferase
MEARTMAQRQSHHAALDEATEIQRIARIYDARAPHWDDREGRAENRMVGDDFRDRLARELRGDVLEIGAGTGETLRRLRALNPPITSYTGVDISTGMLAQASRYAMGNRFPVTFHQANAESLAMFPDHIFDTVTGSLVLCTVPDQEATLRELARVVKPDGQLVLLEHVLPSNPLVKFPMKVFAPIQARTMGCHIDRATHQIIRKLGFSVEQDVSKRLGIFHLIVARPPGATPNG